jgi:hypothetical protein
VRKVAVVGSSSFPLTPEIGAEVVDLLREYPQDTVFLTRGSPGFDQFVMGVCPVLGYRCFAYPSQGGADNWKRDVELARDADEGLVFFDPDSLSDYNTGTAHVVEKMLDQKKPVRAWSEANRRLVFAGATEDKEAADA